MEPEATSGAVDGRPLPAHIALVTGGSRGIGRAVVERLVADRAVAFSYVCSEGPAKQLVADLSAIGGRVHALPADLSRLQDVRLLFERVEELLGGIDILVNNAAETLVAPIIEITEDAYDRLVAVNTKATFFAIPEAAHRLRKGGRIINVSSTNTVMHLPGIAVYAASKAAVEQFTLVAARELALRKITVNTVSPGPVDTEMLRVSQSAQALDMAAAMTPLRRLGQPADIADVIGFVAGSDARWVTGQNIRVTGGLA